jgi:hypothetical protein
MIGISIRCSAHRRRWSATVSQGGSGATASWLNHSGLAGQICGDGKIECRYGFLLTACR